MASVPYRSGVATLPPNFNPNEHSHAIFADPTISGVDIPRHVWDAVNNAIHGSRIDGRERPISLCYVAVRAAIKAEHRKPLIWPASTCVNCGRTWPSGTTQKCTDADREGHLCTWYVPRALRAHIESLTPSLDRNIIIEQDLEIERLNNRLADMATALRVKSDEADDLAHNLSTFVQWYSVGEDFQLPMMKRAKAVLAAWEAK